MSAKQPSHHITARSRSSRNLLYTGVLLVVMVIAILYFVRVLVFLGGTLDTLLSRPEEGSATVMLQSADFELVSHKLRLTDNPASAAAPIPPTQETPSPASSTGEIMPNIEPEAATSTEIIRSPPESLPQATSSQN